jgi:RNA polymerase sigma factor (TIGR02999 family)
MLEGRGEQEFKRVASFCLSEPARMHCPRSTRTVKKVPLNWLRWASCYASVSYVGTSAGNVMSDVTRILSAIEQGDQQASEQLLPLVYEELRRLAAQRLAQEKPGQTLQATALVHEAYLRLVDVPEPQVWSGRGHFFAAAAEAMRRILVEQARRKKRVRHGGDFQRIGLDQLQLSDAADDDELLALNDALDRLAVEEPAAAAVVKLRYFAGLTIEEAATALGVSIRTANRDWAYAKAWLHQQLHDEPTSKD